METKFGFTCMSISPIELSGPGIALATARAGGIGVLDRTFCRDETLDLAHDNLIRLLSLSTPDQRVGLRLTAAQIESSDRLLLQPLTHRPHCLILAEWGDELLADTLNKLPSASKRILLLEITHEAQLETLCNDRFAVDGVVARGHEAGGWVGDDASFILSQKTLQATSLPVYVQGGIGIHTAAACRAAGAVGVVLDDALYLMPESQIPFEWQARIRGSDGQDAVAIGQRFGAAVRVLQRPGFDAVKRLRELCNQLEVERSSPVKWRQLAQQWIGWATPDRKAWPVGQAIGQASYLRERYRTTGRYIKALLQGGLIEVDSSRCSLRLDGPLAKAHGTRYPIVQGPMTRVSDTELFSDEVARAGALPMLALALMPADAVEKLLIATKARLGVRPWGVGVLGFMPIELRDAQFEVIKRVKPPFALIAGGRPDQAAQLEKEGIPTYIHAPTPSLAKLFIEQGSRHLTFEGQECGGHVGPLSSFTLWESIVETLLEVVSDDVAQQMHVLFAGGIHDARSAAMVEGLTAPLVDRGIKVGVLMGTAYLFTEEAVACGAITTGFQRQAIDCAHTVNLETGPGHASRCAVSPFTDEFYAISRQIRASGRPTEEVSSMLDDLCLGRLRVAAKGLARKGSEIVQVDEAQQLNDGMYMIGQVATMRSKVVSLEGLHRSVCEERISSRVNRADVKPEEEQSPVKPSDIAIIGIGSILPKADSPQIYWENILKRVNAVTVIPADRWDWRLYFDVDRKKHDKVYSKWGCFIDDVPFDPMQFGIPPNSLDSIEPNQLLILEVVRRALSDAGYSDGGLDRDNTSVILGYSGGLGELGEQYVTRAELVRRIDSLDEGIGAALPKWTEDSFPGILPNVSAGRVANRFDFGGANFTVDSACASSLTAIDMAVSQLESGRCNVAIAGGVDTKQSPFGYFCFCKTPALSPRGVATPFDASADGIVLGEGIVAVILKRLVDAERDGDRIYALIKSVASSSDGKGLGLTAPRSGGQTKALNRAYRRAGFGPATLGLYEAHGTGTRAGDQTELRTITDALITDRADANTCAVGSVKTLIGHTKGCAGAAGLIKAALALHYRVLPPHPNIETPLAELGDRNSPVYLLKEGRPWLENPDYPRRAAVSAFGFGGTNCHCVLEEYSGGLGRRTLGAENQSCELFLFAAANRDGLLREITLLQDRLRTTAPRLRDLSYSSALRFANVEAAQARLAIAVESLDQLLTGLKLVQGQLTGNDSTKLPPFVRLSICDGSVRPAAGRIAFLFPGQGAQYIDMAREVALYFQEMRSALELGDRTFRHDLVKPLSQYIMPPSTYSESDAAIVNGELKATEIAQPAIGAVEVGYLNLLSRLGVKPDLVAGHSYGEYTALYAAGVLAFADLLQLSRIRGQMMAEACLAAEGAMAAINAERGMVENMLLGSPAVLANHNAPRQSVISGDRRAVEALVQQCQVAGINAHILPVAGAFHSKLMGATQDKLTQAIRAMTMNRPKIPVYSNITAEPYDEDVAIIHEQLARHLLSPVEFVAQVRAMYESGARTFVEVGPKSILTNLVDQTLDSKPHVAVALDGYGGGLRGLLIALGSLFCEGVDLNAVALYADRDCRRLTLPNLPSSEAEPVSAVSSNSWFVNGGGVKAPQPIARSVNRPEPRPLPTITKPPLINEAPSTTVAVRALPAEPQPGPGEKRTNGISAVPLTVPGQDAVKCYQAYQETMQQFLSMQEEIMTRFLSGSAPVRAELPTKTARAPEDKEIMQNQEPLVSAQAPPAPRAEPVPISPADSGLPDRKHLLEQLMVIVSTCTGYPPEMLGPEQDMEAELGIDSIKRVEILAAMQKSLPQELASGVSSRMEHLTRVKTLNGLIDMLVDQSPAKPPPCHAEQTDVETKDVGNSPVSRYQVGRYVMRSWVEPLAASDPLRLKGLVIITEDELSVAAALERRLRGEGLRVAVIERALLESSERLSKAIGDLRERHGKVAGLVHLAGLSNASMPNKLSVWRQTTEIQVKSLFCLLQQCGPDLQDCGGRVLGASMFGGHYGRNGVCGPSLPCAGAHNGFLKTAAIEWPAIHVRALDLEEDKTEVLVDQIAQELHADNAGQEIGYCRGQRIRFDALEAWVDKDRALQAELEPGSGWIVLAIGGARGITAEVVKELSRAGMRLILLGRTRCEEDEPEDTKGIEDIATLRRIFIDQVRGRAETPTPVQVERAITKLQRERDIRMNLMELRKTGVELEYRAVDVTQPDEFVALLDDIYARYGRIDAVIQGAGIIEDKLLADKTRVSFDRVFDTKVNSTYLLCRHLRPESLKLMIFFASVAGRTGNRGQSDYAAANEVMNRFAWWMHANWTRTRVMSINWGPWDVKGMASDEINRQFRERGVIPISPVMGRRFMQEEIRYGDRTEVETVAGVFEQSGEWRERANWTGSARAFPLLRSELALTQDGRSTLNYTFSLSEYPYLDHHRLDGDPVVPAAGAMEVMAEFVQSLWPDRMVTKVSALHVMRGIVLNGDRERQVLLRARAKPKSSEHDGLEVDAEILEPGTQHGFYRCTVVLQTEMPKPEFTQLEWLATTREESAASAYHNHCFHGPRFQLLTDVMRVSAKGIDGKVKLSRPEDWVIGETGSGGWLFDPGVVDAALQSVIVWARLEHGKFPLPSRFGRVTRYGTSPADEVLHLICRIEHFEDPLIRADFAVIDKNGQIWLKLEGMEGYCNTELNRLAPSSDTVDAETD